MLCRLMQSTSTTNDDLDLTNLSNLLGQLFQIRDDYKNLKDPDYAKAKGFCEDLDEGKFSLMMIHGIQNSDEDGKKLLLDALTKARERGEGEELPRELKIEVVEHLDAVGSFEYARAKMAELVMGIKKEYLRVLRQTGLRNVVVEGLVNKLANT